MGKSTLVAATGDFLKFSFAWTRTPPPLWGIRLLVGLPRPQTSRDILRDMTTLGVASLHFIRSEKGEASYSNSSLWKSNEWRNCVINGAAQAFSTRVPEIVHDKTLVDAIGRLPPDDARVVLDNYEASAPLTDFQLESPSSVTVAIGSERGWSAGERSLFRSAGFTFAHLGTRVLRTETACIAAVALIRSKLGLF